MIRLLSWRRAARRKVCGVKTARLQQRQTAQCQRRRPQRTLQPQPQVWRRLSSAAAPSLLITNFSSRLFASVLAADDRSVVWKQWISSDAASTAAAFKCPPSLPSSSSSLTAQLHESSSNSLSKPPITSSCTCLNCFPAKSCARCGSTSDAFARRWAAARACPAVDMLV